MSDRGKLGRGLRIGVIAGVVAAAYRAGRRRAPSPTVSPDASTRFALELTEHERALLEREDAARAAIERASSEMDSLIYTVSHDLKSPLITVLGYIDLLRAENIELPTDAAHYIDRIEAGAFYLQQQINDLLLLSRIGRQEMNAQAVDMTAVAVEVVEELRPAAPAASISIGPMPVITMSPVRARQLLSNLVDNALAHSGRADVIVELGAEPTPGGGARMWVTDDGRGVAEKDRETAFAVFERLGERPPGEGGTGIGLTVCRKIVEHLGGTAELADVPLGATVEIVLPPSVVGWERAEVGAAL